jgi:peptidoglycan/xylan/chitin deacetylase (PgdA/CDA1 family)
MMRSRLGPAALAVLALVSACGRKKGAPPTAEAQPAVVAPAPAVAWSFYELGGLVVIEGEVDRPTRLTLSGTTLREEREAEVGPVRWELYKPPQTETVELQDHEGQVLGTWTFPGVRAKARETPPPISLPSNGGPTDSEVAALASRITWTTTEAQPVQTAAREPRPPAQLPEPPVRMGQVPNPRIELPGSRAGMAPPGDPRNPKPLPEPAPHVNPVVPPRVSVARPQSSPSWSDPRRPGALPEAAPVVSPVIPPRVATARSQAFATPADPRHPGVLPDPTPNIRPVVPPRVGTTQSQAFARPVDPRLPGALPEATPRVSPVYPPRVATTRAHAIGTTTDPRRPGILPEATPEVRPVLPPRASVPSGRTGFATPVDPRAPARLPDPARRETHPAPGAWPGAGEALNLIRGPRHSKNLVLTFDGGSNAEAADEILDTLRAKRIRTTFFLTGVFIQSFPDLTRRIAREGHEIGNHTQNHPHFAPSMRRDPHWTRERFQEELLAADTALFRLLGRPMDPIWRAPYGEHTAEIRGWAEELGYRHVGWTEGADTLDWATPKERKLYRTGNAVMERLHARLKRDGDGLIALMHLGSEREEDDRPSRTLSRFIDRAVKEGWQFVTVGDYLHTLGKPTWDSARRMAWLNSPRPGGTN